MLQTTGESIILEQASRTRATRLPSALRLFTGLTVILTLLSWLFAFVCHLLGLKNPYSWPYYYHSRGTDFYDFQTRFRYFHTPMFFQFQGPSFMYPAPLAVFYRIMFGIWGNRPHVTVALWIFTTIVAFIAGGMFVLALCRRGVRLTSAAAFVLVITVLSYPLYFVMQRGNVEICVFLFTIAPIWAFRTNRTLWAGALLGIAISLKFYPIILIGFLLSEKKYKAIAIALGMAAASTIVAALLLVPSISIALQETNKGMQLFVDHYAKHYSDSGYDHSFFGFFKFFIRPFNPNLPVDLEIYMALAAIGGALLYFLCIRKLPILNQICVLVILSITLPPVSYDYTLLHLYICFGLFALYLVDAQRAGLTIPVARTAMVGFAFALAPHGYIILHHHRYCGQARFIALFGLLCLFLKYPFPEPVEKYATMGSHKYSLSSSL